MKRISFFWSHLNRKMLLAILLVNSSLFYAQDYSLSQILSMADNYFETGSNAIKGRSATPVTWDNMISIIVESDENVGWSIYDIYGNKVSAGNNLQVNTSTLPTGTYTIVVESATEVYQTKFLK